MLEIYVLEILHGLRPPQFRMSMIWLNSTAVNFQILLCHCLFLLPCCLLLSLCVWKYEGVYHIHTVGGFSDEASYGLGERLGLHGKLNVFEVPSGETWNWGRVKAKDCLRLWDSSTLHPSSCILYACLGPCGLQEHSFFSKVKNEQVKMRQSGSFPIGPCVPHQNLSVYA